MNTTDLKDLEQAQEKYMCLKDDEDLLDKISFEISYFFGDLRSNFYSFKTGFSNLWRYKKLIWNDRWYDYAFFMNLLEFKLKDMEEHWGKDTHYMNDQKEKALLLKLLKTLKDIEELEDHCTVESDKEIDKKYEEFGKLLFGITEYTEEYEGKEYTKSCSNIRALWD